MFKIALNAGHGKNTIGKRCLKKLDKNQTREWVLNDRICDKIETKLKAYDGYKLLRVDDTTGKNDIALSKRTKSANNWGADFYLAIHHNAGVKGGTGGGVVAYVYTKPSSKSLDWQKALYNSIIEKTGLKGNRSVPMPKGNLHEVREPKAPSVLLECGFMDSKTDVPIILTDKYADQVATACVDVIVKKGKLTKKKIEEVSGNSNKAKSVTDIAKEVILGKWGNNPLRKQRLKKAGYDYNAVQKAVNKLLKK
jgi:N-acetylmuramoyl-L-alanine amidase